MNVFKTAQINLKNKQGEEIKVKKIVTSNKEKGGASSPDSVIMSSYSEDDEINKKLKFDFEHERQTLNYRAESNSL